MCKTHFCSQGVILDNFQTNYFAFMAKVMKNFNFFGVPYLNHCALFFWLWLLN